MIQDQKQAELKIPMNGLPKKLSSEQRQLIQIRVQAGISTINDERKKVLSILWNRTRRKVL
jgi:hypothetical protein